MSTSVTPFLWFDSEAEEAAELYVSVIPGSRIHTVSRGQDGRAFGVEFEIAGLLVRALNGGPGHPQTDAFSFMIDLETQDEIDRIWEALIADGGAPIKCGWLRDKFGLHWQVVPTQLGQLLGNPTTGAAVMSAMLAMTKIDLAALEAAAR